MSFRYRHGDRPLEGYTIQRGVGRGAFGEVYYAISDGGREVALKTILQNHEIELRGVRHCINLKNPHLVSIFDVRETPEGLPVVIMEYIAGPSLRDLVREYPKGMPAPQAAFLFREIASGLSYLHERGIVHRDLKPENLFFEEGLVKIGDYGLSKYVSLSRQSGQTMSVGTVHYMAPEIGSGIYNQGIDIYALGVMLYELLTGQVPFGGDSFGEILMKHLTAKPDLSGLPEPFRSVVAKALAKKPEDRYESVEAMTKELLRDESLSASLHQFNPASLSVAAKRFEEKNLLAANEETLVASTDETNAIESVTNLTEASVASEARDPEQPAQTTYPAAQAVAEARKPEITPVTPPPGPAGRSPESDGIAKEPASSGELRIDQEQGVARAAILIAAVTAVVVFTRGSIGSGWLAGLSIATTIVGSLLAVLISEGYIFRGRRIEDPFSRRLTTALLSLIPAAVGLTISAGAFGSRRLTILSFLGYGAGMLLIDWSLRLRKDRPERWTVGEAITAAIVGYVAGLFSGPHASLFFAGSYAAVSLALNALAPWSGSSPRKGPGPRAAKNDAQALAGAEPREGRPEPERAAVPKSKDVPLWVLELETGAVPPEAHASDERPLMDSGHADPSWRRVTDRLRGRRRAPFPPHPVTRFCWLFLSALLLAAALCCFTIPMIADMRNEEELISVSCGIALFGFLGFALYRGVWAQRPGFFARSVRPFLITCSMNMAAIGAYLSVMAPVTDYWRIGSEESLVAFCVGAVGIVLLSMLLAIDRLITPDEAYLLRAESIVPAERPVHPFIRVFQLLLAAIGITVACGLAITGLFGSRLDDWDRLSLLAPALAALGLGFYFALQALRRRRGYIWEGTIRPFVITMGLTALSICGLVFAMQPRSMRYGPDGWHRYRGLGEEETVITVVVSIIALVFTSFALFLRGKGRGISRSRLVSWDSSHSIDQAPRSGWLGFGTLLWIGALISALLTIALRLGLPEACGLEQEILRELGDGAWYTLERWLHSSVPPTLLGLLASACVIFARVPAGAAHLLRGVLGQVAFHTALNIALLVGLQANVSIVRGELFVNYDVSAGQLSWLMNIVFATGLVGALLLAWPKRRERRHERAVFHQANS